MARRLEARRTCTENDYVAARMELDQLLDSSDDGQHARRVDELLELIESYEASARLVPDFSGESYANAA